MAERLNCLASVILERGVAEELNCPASVILERSDGIQDFVFYFPYEKNFTDSFDLPFGGVICRRNA